MMKSPWAKNPEDSLTPDELSEWLTYRDLSAIQFRINALGEGYPPYAIKNQPPPDYSVQYMDADTDIIEFLIDMLEGKIK